MASRETTRPADTAADTDAAAVPADSTGASSPAPATETPVRRQSLREWVRDHDEKYLFVILYLGLAVGLSVLVSLFWLVVVAAAHFLLECHRQSQLRRGRKNVLLHALWEVKLDGGLILLALALVLYMEVVLGLLGVQSAARLAAGARMTSRAAAWERNLRTFLLTVDEMARVGYAAYMLRRRGRGGEQAAAPQPAPARRPGYRDLPAWRGRWGIGDWFGVSLVGVGLVVIVLAPLVTGHDLGTMRVALLEELRPLP